MRKMTDSEKLVGRKMPGAPTKLTRFMSQFVRNGNPVDVIDIKKKPWEHSEAAIAEQTGLITISSDKGHFQCRLTQRGKEFAISAHTLSELMIVERISWAQDFLKAKHGAHMKVQEPEV